MTSTVTGLFTNPEQAKEAFNKLESHGFNENQISVVMNDQTRGKAFNIGKGNKAGEGFAIGASLTGLAAAIAAGLAAVGTMAIPGVNIVAAGPIVAAFTGAGIGAAAGGIIGGLIGLGIPEYEAKVYEKHIKEGGILIAVHTKNAEEEKAAREIFHANKNIAA